MTTPTCTQTGMGGAYNIYSSTQTNVTFAIGVNPASDPVTMAVAVFKASGGVVQVATPSNVRKLGIIDQ